MTPVKTKQQDAESDAHCARHNSSQSCTVCDAQTLSTQVDVHTMFHSHLVCGQEDRGHGHSQTSWYNTSHCTMCLTPAAMACSHAAGDARRSHSGSASAPC